MKMKYIDVKLDQNQMEFWHLRKPILQAGRAIDVVTMNKGYLRIGVAVPEHMMLCTRFE